MNFVKSAKYDKQYVKENLMGPNSLKIVEELTSSLVLRSGMKVLDLGCGRGLTSIFLAKEFGVQVYATDLWISATENYAHFKDMGLDNLIVPIHADATNLPFADKYFDAIISVDAYQYFGLEADFVDTKVASLVKSGGQNFSLEDNFMDTKIASLVKSGGQIALAIPGFKEEIHNNLPSVFLISWTAKDLETFHSCKWWRNFLKHSKSISIQGIEEMTCCEECWEDWLACDNEYAINDRGSMRAGAGNYMNIISVLARKI